MRGARVRFGREGSNVRVARWEVAISYEVLLRLFASDKTIGVRRTAMLTHLVRVLKKEVSHGVAHDQAWEIRFAKAKKSVNKAVMG